jgi:hypothetical protein
MSDRPHIVDKESDFVVVGINPDFCEVDGKIVPFDICRSAVHEQAGYAKAVRARGAKVVRVKAILDGVEGNAGKGIVSGVSLDDGCCEVIRGCTTVRAEGEPVARHDDLCWMNGPR